MSISFDDPVSEHDASAVTRGRVIAAAAAVAVIAAAVGAGFALGRAGSDDDGAGEVLAEVAETTPTDDADVPSSPTDEPAGDGEVPATTMLLGESAGDIAMDAPLGSSRSVESSGGTGYSLFGPQPMTPLVERTTPDGYVLRVHKGPDWDQGMGWGVDDWRPAPWCYESAQMRVSISGNGVADVGAVPWFSEPYRGLAITHVMLGVADGAPRWVVVVQVQADAATVTVRFADGATDTATPVNGVAVLTVPATEGPTEVRDGAGASYWQEPTPSFDVTVDGGATAGTVSSDGTGTWADEEFRQACSPPPPALPDAGAQPADPESARTAIETALDTLYGTSDVADRDTLIDDPTGVADARAQVAEGMYADQAGNAAVVVEDLVFTTPTEAWFRYRIETGVTVLDDRYGIAREIDDTWKITRDTLCQDLAMAGGDCGTGWEPVVPPSAREQPIDVIGDPGEILSSEGE